LDAAVGGAGAPYRALKDAASRAVAEPGEAGLRGLSWRRRV